MFEVLIPILTFLAVVAIGGAIVLMRAASKLRLTARLNADISVQDSESADRASEHLLRSLAGRLSVGRPSPQLKALMSSAGYYHENAASIYLGAKMLLFVTASACLAIAVLPLRAPWAVAIAAIVGGSTLMFLVPNVVVYRRRLTRRKEIRHHLPDALDLLQICVSSGMGLDMAWNAVSDEIRGVCPILADEMALTNLELHLGSPRSVAMRRMADRTGAEEISSLVAVLLQSERFGTSISEALRIYAISMRDKRSQQAAENAEKMAVRLLFPMVIFIFPSILVVTVGPACVTLVEMMSD